MLTEAQSVRAAADSFRPERDGSVAEAAALRSATASATNRCPKQRFASTDGLNPVVFHIERIEEEDAC